MITCRLVAFFCVFGFALSSAFADTAEQAAASGGALYEKGDFDGAIRMYGSAIAAGADNGHMHYNLGNALFRAGRYGEAIAAYRKALLQIPRDPDVKANLSLARKRAKGGMEPAANRSVLSAILSPASVFSKHEWLTGSLILCGCFCSVLLLASVRPWDGSRSLVLIALLLWFVSMFYTWGTRQTADGNLEFALASDSQTPAVVLQSGTKVYSGDSDNFQVIFVLDEGAEVDVGEQRGNWIRLRIRGKSGWVHRETLDLIQ